MSAADAHEATRPTTSLSPTPPVSPSPNPPPLPSRPSSTASRRFRRGLTQSVSTLRTSTTARPPPGPKSAPAETQGRAPGFPHPPDKQGPAPTPEEHEKPRPKNTPIYTGTLDEPEIRDGFDHVRSQWIRHNSRIHFLYVSQQHEECLALITQVLDAGKYVSEYALYVKENLPALIRRQEGKISESLQLFQEATNLNPTNISNLKQVARSLFLLGRHRAALDVYDKVRRFAGTDWAIASFVDALNIHRHDTTYTQLGRLYLITKNNEKAMLLYEQAIEISPENSEFLVALGRLYLAKQNPGAAFHHRGSAMAHDPTDAS
ncbi:hypothetical protein BDK51DRAFT_52944, partial [Blyttiomyces helicus]